MPAKVLVAVVDDDASAREAICGLVRVLGFDAVGFASGTSFLGSDEVARTACLITDMRMPDMTGLELHGRLAASGRRISSILITSYEDETLHARATSAGVHCCLAKPLEPEDLLQCIRSAIADEPR